MRTAIDHAKDQTYFLWGLTQEQLARTMFPLGGMTKPEVRALASEFDLPVASKHESYEICFVPNGDYAAFMDAYLREKGVAPEATEGKIVDTDGPRAGPPRRCASLHGWPAKGPGHCRKRAAVRDRDESECANRDRRVQRRFAAPQSHRA